MATESDETQMFGRLNKSVVSVGEPFVYEIEVYATVDGALQADALREAVDSITLPVGADPLRLVRIEPVEASMEPALDGMLVARITRRFVFRADAEGVISIPTPKLDWAGRRRAPVASTITAYRTADSFHDVARGIVPIFVERKDAFRQRTFHRTGSGFFIRHDALVTSFHVVAEADRVHVLLPDGTRIESRDMWSVDPIRDVVVLHVDPNKVRAAGIDPLALAGGGMPPKTGDDTVSEVVFTYGWPGGIRRSTAGKSFHSARLGYDRMWI
ncbi:MAG: S1C family serine protease, partial [Rhodothermales bacterium]|nr:S1C family serine protease [Rhodothermales bacterium]